MDEPDFTNSFTIDGSDEANATIPVIRVAPMNLSLTPIYQNNMQFSASDYFTLLPGKLYHDSDMYISPLSYVKKFHLKIHLERQVNRFTH